MVKIEYLTKLDRSDTQSLDLSSTHSDKIRKIQGLERFNQLLSLNLSNNMIVKIENISFLSHLRILNLDFNQISKIEQLQSLNQLQQLSLSYNCITNIPQEIEANRALRVLQMSYNDLKSIEDIRALSSLKSLSILSLAGNPFLTTLNYLSFIKMLVPSLLLLDSKDTTQSLISVHVHPQEEILILRDALNKLIDQRNSRPQVEPTPQETKSPKPFNNSEGRSGISILDPSEQRHRHSFGRSISFGGNERQQLLELLEEWIGVNSNKIESKRIEISQLSEDYSRRISQSGLKNQFTSRLHQLQEKIRRYRELEMTGILQAEKRHKLIKMQRDVKGMQEAEDAKRQGSRLALNNLKGKESQYCKLKQKNSLLQSLKSKIEANPVLDPHKLFLSQILFGHQSYDLNYKQIKKYLVYPKGLIEIIRTLNNIVFGQAADYDRILRLKEFLGSRSLIEIINNLKELGLGYKKEMKKYQKQKNKIIQKLETEALELCQEWRQVQKQKQSLRRSRQIQSSSKQPIVEERYYQIQTEERNRIMQLKKEKELYDKKIEDLKKSLESLQNQFQRKYKQLQQFQHFFEQFKSDKQIAHGLKQQMEQTQRMISNKQMILTQIDQNIKDLSYKQETLQERVVHFERKLFEKSQEYNHYEQKLKVLHDKIKRGNQQFNLKSFDFVKIQQQFNKLLEQNREYEKKIQRHRNTYELFQQKLKNLNEIEANKKSTLASIQAQIQSEKKRLNEIQGKVQQSQQKLNRNMEMSYQYQLKIQQGKKSIESLSDINKTLSDMLQRQNQLKRSNLQLQLENQHLIELKSKLIEQIKDKYDDQDENL